MRRAAIFVVLVLGVAGLIYLLWSPEESSPKRSPSPQGGSSEVASSLADSAPEKMNAVLLQPVQAQQGSGSIRGRVISKGEPVPGATVTATRAESEETLSELGCHCDNVCGRMLLECGCGEASEQLKTLVAERRGEVVPIARTITGADGTFELARLDPGKVALWADSRQLGTALKQGVPVGSSAVEVELGSGLTLEGKVTIDGAPAPANAWVTAIHGEQSRFFDVLTQAEGKFSIGPLPVGRYSLVAGSPSALAGHEHLRDSKTDGLEIALYSPRTVIGTVELDGKPVAGILVKMDGNHRKDEVVTAGDGSFRFTQLRPGKYELSALRGTLRGDASARVPAKGDPETALISLAESAKLSGTVRSVDGPIAGANVRINSMGKQGQVVTASDGRFELNWFAGKGMDLRVWAEGFVDDKQDVDLEEGGQATVNIVLVRESAISGRVIDEDGAPISHADISARASLPASTGQEEPDDFDLGAFEMPNLPEAEWVKSDDAGMFVVKKIKPGDYRLDVSHSDYRPAEVTARAPSAQMEVQLRAGLRLTGEVVSDRGAPVGGATVVVWDPKDKLRQAPHQGDSDKAGRFRVGGLSEGVLQIRADSKTGNVSQEVSISSSRPNHIRLVLKSVFSISGTVVDSAGTPVNRAMVRAATSDDRGGNLDLTDESGAFEVEELGAGEFALTVYSQEHEPVSAAPMTVKAGTKDLRLVVKPRPVARGRVVDAKGKPIKTFQINSKPFDDPAGSFKIALGSQPEQQLKVRSPGYLEVAKKVRVEGRDLEVGDIVLGGREVRVRTVAAATGQPLANADIWNGAEWGTRRGSPLAFTGKDGWTTVRGLPTSGAVLVANHQTHRKIEVKLADGETERVIQMDPGSTWVLRVQDPDGKPTEGVAIVSYEAEQATYPQPVDKTGTARLQGMSAGKWTAVVTNRARSATRLSAKLTVTLPETGEVTSVIKLAAGHIALSLQLGKPPGQWTTRYTYLLPNDSVVPRAASDMLESSLASIEGVPTGAPEEFKFTGVHPGRQIAVVWLKTGMPERHSFYAVPVEVSAAPSQTFTLPPVAATALIEWQPGLE